MIRRALIGLLIGLVSGLAPARQQAAGGTYDVFYSSGPKPAVYFVDARTGLSTVAETNGIRHTLVGSAVLFADKDTGQIGLAAPDGTVQPHPFIEAGETTTWAVSADRNWIAWAVGHTQAGSLLTDLYLARADGSSKQLALHTSSTKGIGVRPLLVANDGETVFYTRQADDPKAALIYPLAADIYRLTVSTGDSIHLPGEPRCRCAVAISTTGQIVFRLENAPNNQAGFVAHFLDLSANGDTRADPLPDLAFAQAGYALLSDKGTYAVYSIAAKGTASAKNDQYAIVLADAAQRRQRVILKPSPNRLKPVLFEQDAILLNGLDKDGTYKLSITTGTLTQVSAYNYLGLLVN